eukprot:5540375-Prymnesium_polylepis.2
MASVDLTKVSSSPSLELSSSLSSGGICARHTIPNCGRSDSLSPRSSAHTTSQQAGCARLCLENAPLLQE